MGVDDGVRIGDHTAVGALFGEGVDAGDDLVEHDAERVEVAARRGRVTEQHFGGCVEQAAVEATAAAPVPSTVPALGPMFNAC